MPRRREPKPKTPKNVRADYSGGRWRYRALVRVGGQQHVGPMRDSPRAAKADVEAVRARGERVAGPKGITLDAALRKCEALAREGGMPEPSVRATWKTPRERFLEFWDVDTPLESISAEELCWCIDTALAGSPGRDPYKPITLIQKWLPAFSRACRQFEVPDPVPRAKQMRKLALRVTPKLMPWMSPEEVAKLMQRMRDYPVDGTFKMIERDKALVWLVYSTGVRPTELSRVRRADVDPGRNWFPVVKAKDTTHPRQIHVSGPGKAALETLLKDSEGGVMLLRGGIDTCNHVRGRWQERLNEPRLTWRALRHSFLSGLRLMGADLLDIQAAAGHRIGSKATQTYIHSADAHLRRSSELLSGTVERLVGSASESPQEPPESPAGSSE